MGNCSGADAEEWVCGREFQIYSAGHNCVCRACGHRGTGGGIPLPPESKVWLGTGRTYVFGEGQEKVQGRVHRA